MKDQDTARTHNGTYSLFSKKYIATGILSTEEGNHYRQLFTMRQSGDYDDLFDWTEDDVIPMISRVELLLAKMKTILKSK